MLPDQTGTIDATEATFDHATERFAEEWREQLAAMRGDVPRCSHRAPTEASTRFRGTRTCSRRCATTARSPRIATSTAARGPARVVPRSRATADVSASWRWIRRSRSRYRRIVSQWFSRLAIDAYRPRLREIIGWAFDRVSDRGSTDVVADLANPIPAIVTMDFLGIDLREWHLYGDAIHSGARRAPGSGQKLKVMMHEVDELVCSDRPAPGRADRPPLAGRGRRPPARPGHRPGDHLHAAQRRHRHHHVHDRQHGRRDRRPSRRARAAAQRSGRRSRATVQELLRYCAPATGAARTVTAETEIEGVALHPGDRVLLLLSSANLDESELCGCRPARPVPRCRTRMSRSASALTGASAPSSRRAELEIFVAELMARMPDFAVDRAAVTPYPTIPLVKGYVSVPITFPPRPPGHVAGADVPRLTAPRLAPAR